MRELSDYVIFLQPKMKQAYNPICYSVQLDFGLDTWTKPLRLTFCQAIWFVVLRKPF